MVEIRTGSTTRLIVDVDDGIVTIVVRDPYRSLVAVADLDSLRDALAPDSLPVVMDLEGLRSLGVGAIVSDRNSIFKYSKKEDGRWCDLTLTGMDWADFRFFSSGYSYPYIVENEGAPIPDVFDKIASSAGVSVGVARSIVEAAKREGLT